MSREEHTPNIYLSSNGISIHFHHSSPSIVHSLLESWTFTSSPFVFLHVYPSPYIYSTFFFLRIPYFYIPNFNKVEKCEKERRKEKKRRREVNPNCQKLWGAHLFSPDEDKRVHFFPSFYRRKKKNLRKISAIFFLFFPFVSLLVLTCTRPNTLA